MPHFEVDPKVPEEIPPSTLFHQNTINSWGQTVI
jgi:hypothetical protein